jgi:hypothetical protein
MSKAKAVKLSYGRKNRSHLYCTSKTGNVYVLTHTLNNKLPTARLKALELEIREAGVIDTTLWTKVRKPRNPRIFTPEGADRLMETPVSIPGGVEVTREQAKAAMMNNMRILGVQI